mmetsp:Transcript_8928/g.23355  ORF Transcript_8928/g.23355 Transcript_8928/m.23355 type:complete len:349 (+) Transcript_8928:708-1754(+)
MGCGRYHAAWPLAPAALHQIRRLDVHQPLRRACGRRKQTHSRRRVERCKRWRRGGGGRGAESNGLLPARRQRRRLQLRGRRLGNGRGRRRRRVLCDGWPRRPHQAMGLHGDQRTPPLGHLCVRAAGGAQELYEVRPRALGIRRPWRRARAPLPPRMALLPLPLRACRAARAAACAPAGPPARLLRPLGFGDAASFEQLGRLGQDHGDAPRAGTCRLLLHTQAQVQRVRGRGAGLSRRSASSPCRRCEREPSSIAPKKSRAGGQHPEISMIAANVSMRARRPSTSRKEGERNLSGALELEWQCDGSYGIAFATHYRALEDRRVALVCPRDAFRITGVHLSAVSVHRNDM